MITQLLRLTKHSAIYGIGHILSRSISILLLPLHTKFIPPDEYAAYVYGYAFIPVAAIFFSAGLNTGQLKYYIESNSIEEKRIIFSTSFWTTCLFGLLLIGIMVLTAPYLAIAIFGKNNYVHLILLSIIILFFDALNLLMFNLLRAEERSIEFISFSCFTMVANIGLNFYLIIVAQAGVEAIFLANAVSSALATILLLPGSRRYFVMRISRRYLKKMVLFGLPLIPSTIGMVILMAIDRFFIREYLGDKAAALYGAGYRLGMFMSLLVTAFKYAWNPFYLIIAKTDKNANEIFARVLTYFLLISCFIFLFISLFIDNLVRMNILGLSLIDRQYWGGISIVPAILASYIFCGIFLNMQVGPYVQNKTYLLAFTTAIAAVTNIGLNFILIPKLELIGAAIATLIAYAVLALSLYGFTRKTFIVPYEWGRISKLFIITSIIFFCHVFYFNDASIFIKLGLMCIFGILLFISSFFKKGEISFMRKIIDKNLGRQH